MNEVNIKAYPKIKPMRVLQEIGGVYLFYLKGKVIYIGQTSNFNQRENTHLSSIGAATLKGKLAKTDMYSEEDLKQVKLRFVPIEKREKRLKIERILINELNPLLNGVKGKPYDKREGDKFKIKQVKTRMTDELEKEIEKWRKEKGLLLKETYYRLLKTGLNVKKEENEKKESV